MSKAERRLLHDLLLGAAAEKLNSVEMRKAGYDRWKEDGCQEVEIRFPDGMKITARQCIVAVANFTREREGRHLPDESGDGATIGTVVFGHFCQAHFLLMHDNINEVIIKNLERWDNDDDA